MKFSTEDLKKSFSVGKDLYIFLIVLCLLIFAVYPFIQNESWGMFIINSVFSVLIYFGAVSVGVYKDKKWFLFFLVIVSVISNYVVIFTNDKFIQNLHILIRILILVIISYSILHRILTEGTVSVYNISGAIIVYLLSGLIWAFTYYLIYDNSADSFELGSKLMNEKDLTWNFIYLSFNKLTTLGYHEIEPVSHFPMALAALEGLFGQLFPVVLISRFVSGSSRKNN